MNGFKFDFSKIFWGGAHRAPSPGPLPPLFLGLRPRFGLRPQFSGFALDTRALRALDSGFALNFRLGTLVCPPPPKINSWIRPCPTVRQKLFRIRTTVSRSRSDGRPRRYVQYRVDQSQTEIKISSHLLSRERERGRGGET